MTDWQTQLSYDLLPTLLSSENEPLTYFVERDLLEKKVFLESLWESPDALRLVCETDGWWVGSSIADHWSNKYENGLIRGVTNQLTQIYQNHLPI